MPHPALTSPTATNPPDQPIVLFLNKSETAKALAISEKTLDLWIDEFGLPKIKMGRSVRFSIKALNNWIDNILPQLQGRTDESNT